MNKKGPLLCTYLFFPAQIDYTSVRKTSCITSVIVHNNNIVAVKCLVFMESRLG